MRQRFKVDENLSPDLAAALVRAGHDAVTVSDQRMQGTADDRLARVCRAEGRALVTLDLGFADIRVYPPGASCGVVLLRPSRELPEEIEAVTRQLIRRLRRYVVGRSLWIADRRRVRVRRGPPPGCSDRVSEPLLAFGGWV